MARRVQQVQLCACRNKGGVGGVGGCGGGGGEGGSSSSEKRVKQGWAGLLDIEWAHGPDLQYLAPAAAAPAAFVQSYKAWPSLYCHSICIVPLTTVLPGSWQYS